MMKMKGYPDFKEERRLWKKGYRVVIGVDEVGRGAFAGPVTVGAVCFTLSITDVNGRLDLREEEVLEHYLKKIGVNDSKVLRPRKREALAKEIRKLALGHAVASASVGEINKLGIKRATERAFRRAVARLLDHDFKSYGILPREGFHLGGVVASPAERGQPATIRGAHNPKSLKFGNSKTYVLVDAFHIKYLRGIGLSQQKAIKKGDKKSLSIAAASILAKVHRDNLMKKLSRRYPKYRWAKNKGYGTKEHQKAILGYGLTGLHRKVFVQTFLKNHLSSRSRPEV